MALTIDSHSVISYNVGRTREGSMSEKDWKKQKREAMVRRGVHHSAADIKEAARLENAQRAKMDKKKRVALAAAFDPGDTVETPEGHRKVEFVDSHGCVHASAGRRVASYPAELVTLIKKKGG